MSTRLSKDEKEKLRREVGLLTITEAAGILDCDEIDVHRQICFGQFALNADAKGRFLISQADIHGFAGSSLASQLQQTPKIGPDGWFRIPGPMDRNRFLKKLAASGRRQSLSESGRAELREYLVAELRLCVFKDVRRLPVNLRSRSATEAEKLYRQGPAYFEAATQRAKQKLLGRTIDIGGNQTKLSTVIPGLSRIIDEALTEAF